MTMMEFATPGAMALIDAEGDNGPDCELEDYYSPDESEKVCCTTEEREDFEQYHERALTADVISDQEGYDLFVRFLVENYELAKI